MANFYATSSLSLQFVLLAYALALMKCYLSNSLMVQPVAQLVYKIQADGKVILLLISFRFYQNCLLRISFSFMMGTRRIIPLIRGLKAGFLREVRSLTMGQEYFFLL